MMRQPIQSPAAVGGFSPPQINSLDDTGLSPLWLQDLILKVLYFRGYLTGHKVAEEIALPLAGVTDQLLTTLKQEKFIEVKSSQGGLGEGAYTFNKQGRNHYLPCLFYTVLIDCTHRPDTCAVRQCGEVF